MSLFTPFTPAQAHQFNIDCAQREIDSRSAEGEDMSRASINQRTYAIVNPQAGKDHTTCPAAYAAMDAAAKEFWAYPDAEWQDSFLEGWAHANPGLEADNILA